MALTMTHSWDYLSITPSLQTHTSDNLLHRSQHAVQLSCQETRRLFRTIPAVEAASLSNYPMARETHYRTTKVYGIGLVHSSSRYAAARSCRYPAGGAHARCRHHSRWMPTPQRNIQHVLLLPPHNVVATLRRPRSQIPSARGPSCPHIYPQSVVRVARRYKTCPEYGSIIRTYQQYPPEHRAIQRYS